MAPESVNYQCPACTGPLRFDAPTGKLTCDYCGSTFTAEEVEAYYAEKQAKQEAKAAAPEGDSAAERVAQANQAAATPACDRPAEQPAEDPIQAYLDSKRSLSEDDDGAHCVECASCGAQLITTETAAVTRCPYCGNNAIIPGVLGETLEPDYLIPFSTTKEQAIAALTKHYEGKFLLPKVFKERNHIEEIQGVYVPFWLFDGFARKDMSFRCENVHVWSDSEFNYTETSHYKVFRNGTATFLKVPVDGSKRMPNDHMDSIEPFDYSQMKPFSMGYLPGFLADRYDESVQECSARAINRLGGTLEDELTATTTQYQSTHVRREGEGETTFSNVAYALLPVWMLHTRWNDQDFLFAMNGQTGKMVGDLPIDKSKLFLTTIVTFLVTLIVAVVVSTLIVMA